MPKKCVCEIHHFAARVTRSVTYTAQLGQYRAGVWPAKIAAETPVPQFKTGTPYLAGINNDEKPLNGNHSMNEEYEPEEPGMVPPGRLAKSFIVVAGCYTLFIVGLFGSFIGVTRLFFPDIFATLQDQTVINEVMKHDPESVLTRELFWTWLGTIAVLCFVIGWLAVCPDTCLALDIIGEM